MTLEELLKRYEANEDSYLIMEQYFFNKAIKDEVQQCAFTAYQIMRTAAIEQDVDQIITNIICNLELMDSYRESIKDSYEAMFEEGTPEYIYCKEAAIMAEVFGIDNSRTVLGYVSDEVMRSFTLHQVVDVEDIQSAIDRILYTYSRLFEISSYEFRDLAVAQRIVLIEGVMQRIHDEGDLLLMDQMRTIYTYILEWR